MSSCRCRTGGSNCSVGLFPIMQHITSCKWTPNVLFRVLGMLFGAHFELDKQPASQLLHKTSDTDRFELCIPMVKWLSHNTTLCIFVLLGHLA